MPKSDPPNSSSSSSIKGSFSIPKNFIPWRLIIVGIVIFLGGGGVGSKATDLINGGGERKGPPPEYHIRFVAEQKQAHDKINETTATQAKEIKAVKVDVKAIKKVTFEGIAREEARRVTKSIQNPERRAEKFIRIYQKNLYRLRHNKGPCVDIKCVD